MAVVIGQSRATAHVYRIFGALIALLMIMGVAVAVIRVRTDRGVVSPYGALAGVSSRIQTGSAAAPPTVAHPQVAASVEPPKSGDAAPVAAPMALVAADPVSPPPPVADKAPVAGPTPVPPVASPVEPARPAAPRQIALGKGAADGTITQPAPPALVAAAAAAAAKPPAPTPTPAPAAAPGLAKAATATEVAATSGPKVASLAPEPAASAPSGGRININRASVDQLNSLPGIGRVGRYIASHRPYRSIDDLVDRRVLKARDFARIRSMISTD